MNNEFNGKMVYICSPLQSESKVQFQKNICTARNLAKKIINTGNMPIAPQIYFTELLNDCNLNERGSAMEMSEHLLKFCDILVYEIPIENFSEGMKRELDIAERLGSSEIKIMSMGEFLFEYGENYESTGMLRTT